MFTELMPLLRQRRLLLTLAFVAGDTIRATVIPQKTAESEDAALTIPLALTGTAEELDREFARQLLEFTGAHLELQTTLLAARAEIDGAAQAAREAARKKSPKSAANLTPAASSPEPPPPPLFAQAPFAEDVSAEQEVIGGAAV